MILKWIKKYWPGGTFVLAGGVVGFFAGQYVPAYIEYANEQRGEVAELIDKVSTKGDEFERSSNGRATKISRRQNVRAISNP
jgi:hypothetical protein